MHNDTLTKTLMVTIGLCLLCSLVVSTAAVVLSPLQEKNKKNALNVSVLQVAGIYRPDIPVEEQFAKVRAKVIDLSEGVYVDTPEPDNFDMVSAARNPDFGTPLSKADDIAGISYLPRYAKIYLISSEGEPDKIVLPIYGYGLWSVLYGFITLEADANTVYALQFYQHGETPGLGGRVDDPKWRALWQGKKVYATDSEPRLSVVKGQVNDRDPLSSYKVDGLSGATLTGLGVDHMIDFWFGQMGYRKFLEKQFYGMATRQKGSVRSAG